MNQLQDQISNLSLDQQSVLFQFMLDNYVSKISYQSKVETCFKIIPQSDFHNYKWRELIQLESLGIVDNRGHKVHGPDSDEFSLKSSKHKSNRSGVHNITRTTSLGTFGRVDKQETHDMKDTLCTIFSETGEKILSVKIYFDDNFKIMYESLRQQKQKLMENSNQTMDSVNINFNLIYQWNLKWDLLYQSNKVVLSIN